MSELKGANLKKRLVQGKYLGWRDGKTEIVEFTDFFGKKFTVDIPRGSKYSLRKWQVGNVVKTLNRTFQEVESTLNCLENPQEFPITVLEMDDGKGQLIQISFKTEEVKEYICCQRCVYFRYNNETYDTGYCNKPIPNWISQYAFDDNSVGDCAYGCECYVSVDSKRTEV
jgi:hypothetical protein